MNIPILLQVGLTCANSHAIQTSQSDLVYSDQEIEGRLLEELAIFRTAEINGHQTQIMKRTFETFELNWWALIHAGSATDFHGTISTHESTTYMILQFFFQNLHVFERRDQLPFASDLPDQCSGREGKHLQRGHHCSIAEQRKICCTAPTVLLILTARVSAYLTVSMPAHPCCWLCKITQTKNCTWIAHELHVSKALHIVSPFVSQQQTKL